MTTKELGPCVSCGAMVPDGDVYPWPGHSPDCGLAAAWRTDHVDAAELRAEIEALKKKVAHLIASGECCTCCVENDCDCMEGVTW